MRYTCSRNRCVASVFGILIHDEGYIPTVRALDLLIAFITESVKYVRTLHEVFAKDSFSSSGENKNSFVLVSSGGEEDCSLSVAKVLLLFRIVLRGSNESQ